MRKPDRAIYEFVFNDAGINTSDTLFIDDSHNNIKTATDMGIMCHLLLPGERIEDLKMIQS